MSLGKFKEILDNFGGRPAPKADANAIPEGMTRCGCSKKFMPLDEIKILSTPKCKVVLDYICDECLKECKTHAKIVCRGCKMVVTRVAPHTSGGFKFEPFGLYHVPFCPNCKPDCPVSTPVEEAAAFNKERKR